MSTSKTSSRDGPTASTCDDDVCSERRQTVALKPSEWGILLGGVALCDSQRCFSDRFKGYVDIPRRRLIVRFGSLADILRWLRYVRFTPESGHRKRFFKCPLWAKGGH